MLLKDSSSQNSSQNRDATIFPTISNKELVDTLQNTAMVCEGSISFASEKEIEFMACSYQKDDS
jgi:hypothetical protein